MANQVYANNMEVSCKAANGKSVAAFPDVCFTPPQTPATPPGVPIPYPNTGLASDTTNGSRSVRISKKEVMLKNKSYFKKSYGDEAGCAPKKGIITSRNMGKVYFNAWSMNVRIEGENAVRMMDITTHNHGSFPGNTPTWPYIDEMAISADHPCVKHMNSERSACKDFSPHKENGPSPCPPDGKPATKNLADSYADKTAANKCLSAQRCQLKPYSPSGKQTGCCPGQTGHHLVEAGSFYDVGRGGKNSTSIMHTSAYSEGKAPCICVEGQNQYHGTHGLMHTFQSNAALSSGASVKPIALEGGKIISLVSVTYGQAKQFGINAVKKTFPESACDPDCLAAQLDAYHNQCGITDSTDCRVIATGYKGDNTEELAISAVRSRSEKLQKTWAAALSSR